MSDDDLDAVETDRLFEAIQRRSKTVLLVVKGGDNKADDKKALGAWRDNLKNRHDR